LLLIRKKKKKQSQGRKSKKKNSDDAIIVDFPSAFLSEPEPDPDSLFADIVGNMSAPLITTSICAAAAAAAARRSSSSTLTRIAAFATSATATATTPNLGFHRSGGQRRCFAAHGRDASPLRRTTTNDIVGGRSTIGVFTPITASLWIERLQREEGATLPPKPAEGPLPPSASAVAVFYSFTSDAQLRELYRNP